MRKAGKSSRACPRRIDTAKRLLAEAGYAGEPITLMAAQDIAHHKVWGDVADDLLRRLGMKVDFAAVDWGTVVARREQKSPPSQGGWHMYITAFYGVDCADPTNLFLPAAGNRTLNGWANDPQIEAQVSAWFDATRESEEKAAARRLNKSALDHVVYAPLGMFLRYFAWRKNVIGIDQAPLGGQQDSVRARPC
jgi:peptide/nickel transport system substrate-binding protein